VRVRNFGFLVNRRRATPLPFCFHLFGVAQKPPAQSDDSSASGSSDFWRCPKCDEPMKVIERFTATEMQFSFSPGAHGRRMKRLSSIRILRVFRHSPYLSALPPNKFLHSALPTTLFEALCCRSQLIGPLRRLLRSAARPARGRQQCSFPSFNLRRVSARRNHGGSLQTLYRSRPRTPCSRNPLLKARLRRDWKLMSGKPTYGDLSGVSRTDTGAGLRL
jgi:hypothetical protein